jgi:hypothetical protein
LPTYLWAASGTGSSSGRTAFPDRADHTGASVGVTSPQHGSLHAQHIEKSVLDLLKISQGQA